MTDKLPELGKISPEVFSELIFPRIGAPNADILVGPRNGVDVGITRVAPGTVMATTTDPVFIVPAYGFERAAWFAVHILVSDAVTSGLVPSLATIDLNLPPSMNYEELGIMWNTMHGEFTKMGISVVSGHTARYEGCDYPMVGGATIMAIGPEDSYITPEMARPGDAVIITKGPAVEAAGLFAVSFPDLIREKFGKKFADEAAGLFYRMSVVPDAAAAVSVGVRDNGVTTMHDATECGIIGGLFEIAKASGVGMHIDRNRIPVLPFTLEICEEFGMDAYSAISEGTLLCTARAEHADNVIHAMEKQDIPAAIVGEVLPEEKGMTIKISGAEEKLVHPVTDPFWKAFGMTMAQVQGDSGK